MRKRTAQDAAPHSYACHAWRPLREHVHGERVHAGIEHWYWEQQGRSAFQFTPLRLRLHERAAAPKVVMVCGATYTGCYSRIAHVVAAGRG